MRLRVSTWAAAALVMLAGLIFVACGLGPDFRGSVLGVVTDSQGGAMPGVSVTVTNLNTNVATTVTTDGKGQYRVQFLISGTYSVQMQLQGFKSVVRKPLEVRVGDVLTVDGTLEAGTVEEVIEVVAQQPLLDTSLRLRRAGDRQQPDPADAAGRRHGLHADAPGARASRTPRTCTSRGRRTTATWPASSPTASQGGNEFTLDGAPNRCRRTSARAAWSASRRRRTRSRSSRCRPTRFDAQTGQTAGASVNLALKSGTNAFHGSCRYFNRDDSRSSTPLLTERAGGAKPHARLQPLHRRRCSGPDRQATRRSSWCRSSTCATCSRSRPPSPCRP